MDNLPTRQTLLLKIKNQYDDDSWTEFIQYYQGFIKSVLIRSGVHNSDVEDMSQTLVLKLWKKLPDFNYQPQKGLFKAWLKTIIRNSVSDYFKTAAKENNVAYEESTVDINTAYDEEWMVYIAELAWKNIQNKFEDKVLTIYARLAKGESPEVIAQETKLVRGSVYVYKERVQKALRREIRLLENQLS